MANNKQKSIAKCVLYWADSDEDDGDEVRHWFVALGDDGLDPVGTIYNFDSSERRAKSFACDLSAVYKLPIEYID